MIHFPPDQVVPYSELDRLPEPTRQIGKWRAFSHHGIAEALVELMKERKLSPGSGTWWISPSGMQMYGVVPVGRQTDLYMKVAEPIQPVYILVNDATGRDGVRLGIGAWMTDTETGFLAREIRICRQFKNLDPNVRIRDRFEMLRLDQVSDAICFLKRREISDADGTHGILKAFDRGLINQACMFKARDYWAYPRFGEYRHCTSWMLYRALSDVCTLISPPRQIKLLRGLPMIVGRPSADVR